MFINDLLRAVAAVIAEQVRLVDTVRSLLLDDPVCPHPEIAKVLMEETEKSVRRGESLDTLLNRLFGPGAGFGRRRKKGRSR